MGDTKLERVLPKNQPTRRKLLNFETGLNGRCQKWGIILEKSDLKIDVFKKWQ